MKKAELELYTDCWISTLGSAAATGLSSMVEGDVRHDRATRFLSERVLMDSGFASVENFEFIVNKEQAFYRSVQRQSSGRFVRIDTLELSDKQVVRGWLKGNAEEGLLVRQVFTNKDGSTGWLNLVCRDWTGNGDTTTAIYQKRWQVEVFHQSLKANAALAKSPTCKMTTQNNHVFMSIAAEFKLECLKLKHKTNHFTLRAKLFIKATRQAYAELQALRAA
jgi:hypothetical protein